MNSSRLAHSEARAQFFPSNKSAMLPKDTFKDKIALVTGGGTGLGKSLTQMLSSLGASVVISSRRQDVLDATAKEIAGITGNNKILPVAADVRQVEQVNNVLDQCKITFGSYPTLIVNNAAGNFISPTERLSPNAFKTIVDIVLLGTFNTTTCAAKKLIPTKTAATFLSITTIYAETGSAFVIPSACAKSGVETMTKSLAAEWDKYGFRLNCIAPGPIETKGAFARLDPTGEFSKKGAQRIPAGRFGEAEELANLACYLLSDYSSWVNGTVVRFDGGELNAISGEFNFLSSITDDQWDAMEKMIRSTKGSKL